MSLDTSNYHHISYYLTIDNFQQIFPDNDKQKYGAIFTPFSFIETMFDYIDVNSFSNPNLKWCDLGCGLGYFSIFLYFKLMENLICIPDKSKRSEHIINNMIYMIDIQENYIPFLKKIFGNNANIICNDVLTWNSTILFDFVISNPPFHCNHIKQVPTNKETKDLFTSSKTIWPKFIFKGINLLNSTGHMLMVVPSLWCKYDSYGIYDLIIKRIIKLRLYNNTQINKIFNYQAQTPCSIFLASKQIFNHKNSFSTFLMYDSILQNYTSFSLYKNKQTIPMESISLCSRLFSYTLKYGNIEQYCIRSKMPSIKVKLNNVNSDEYPYINIHSTILDIQKDFSQPKLVIKYSNIPCAFNNKSKLILAHKMYGFPFYDISGNYGISNRDNYIIYNFNHEEFLLFQSFTTSILFIFILECFKYRMKMIEPCITMYIPNITNMNIELKQNLDINNNDEFWFDVFKCSLIERQYIRNHFSKNYNRIPIIE